MSPGIALQDRYFPQLPCFGCGPANEQGLRLKSYAADDGLVVAHFTPWPQHDNGLGYLNGGIIATVLDCHSAAAVTHEAHQRGWPPLPGAALPYVTAGLDVRYLRPAPLDQAITLGARIVAASEAEMRAEVWVEWDGKERSRAEALWKRWRPR
ncbi:PaaI family thioesterase [Nocardioides sp. CBS4Y-1]|uniref:PaaI family thioesterase n=1 Tax=Nocardioides acrostichi TaxID=2784339 RepID=A0A930V106_9ACTN|nr:PaaI family thioesterase [Nocardioides acrostichi]